MYIHTGILFAIKTGRSICLKLCKHWCSFVFCYILHNHTQIHLCTICACMLHTYIAIHISNAIDCICIVWIRIWICLNFLNKQMISWKIIPIYWRYTFLAFPRNVFMFQRMCFFLVNYIKFFMNLSLNDIIEKNI